VKKHFLSQLKCTSFLLFFSHSFFSDIRQFFSQVGTIVSQLSTTIESLRALNRSQISSAQLGLVWLYVFYDFISGNCSCPPYGHYFPPDHVFCLT
jgi:hypothetical protein